MVYIEEQNSIIYSHQIGHLIDRDALFEFHLKFWNTASIGGLTAQQQGTTARWDSNKTSLVAC